LYKLKKEQAHLILQKKITGSNIPPGVVDTPLVDTNKNKQTKNQQQPVTNIDPYVLAISKVKFLYYFPTIY